MKKPEQLFTQTNMTWKRVIVFAVLCGVIPGVLMIPAGLKGTSFQQPGISFEFWIFTALFIILNCEKPLEAGLKTFVYFLISQPLIYLVQVPFAQLHWQLFQYYPYWAFVTLLTFPGAMIAWYVKKGNLWSVAILSIANVLLCCILAMTVHSMIKHFPCYILSSLFIVFELCFFIRLNFKKKMLRLLAFGLVILMLIFFGVQEWNIANYSETFEVDLQGEGPFEILTEYQDVGIAIDGNKLWINVNFYTDFPIDFRDAAGNVHTIYFSYHEDGVHWEQSDH